MFQNTACLVEHLPDVFPIRSRCGRQIAPESVPGLQNRIDLVSLGAVGGFVVRVDRIGEELGREQLSHGVDRVAHALCAERGVIAVTGRAVVHPEEFTLLQRHEPDQGPFRFREVDFDHDIRTVCAQFPHQSGYIEGQEVIVTVDPILPTVFRAAVSESGLGAVERIDCIPLEEADPLIRQAFQIVEQAVVELAYQITGGIVPLCGIGHTVPVADDPFRMAHRRTGDVPPSFPATLHIAQCHP